MKDSPKEEREEKKSFKKIGKEVSHLEGMHKGYKAGGPTSADRKAVGRNQSRIKNQIGHTYKAGRGS